MYAHALARMREKIQGHTKAAEAGRYMLEVSQRPEVELTPYLVLRGSEHTALLARFSSGSYSGHSIQCAAKGALYPGKSYYEQARDCISQHGKMFPWLQSPVSQPLRVGQRGSHHNSQSKGNSMGL